MQETRLTRCLPIVLPLLLALISLFFLSGPASSAQFHADSLAALEEKQTTVLELSAASAAASAAITLIPGACGAYLLNVLFGWKGLRVLAYKLAAFGLLIFLVIPVSLQLSHMIETTYQDSIDATIESARETTSAVESAAEDEAAEDEGFWAGLISSITEGIGNVTAGITDKVGGMVNDFMEALAVMLVTSCVIPILVLLSFVWLAKALLALDIPIRYEDARKGFKRVIFQKKKAGDP